MSHNKQGGYMMTNYIIQKGYQKIGFFCDLDYSLSFQDRFLGYKLALMNHHMIQTFHDNTYIQ